MYFDLNSTVEMFHFVSLSAKVQVLSDFITFSQDISLTERALSNVLPDLKTAVIFGQLLSSHGCMCNICG